MPAELTRSTRAIGATTQGKAPLAVSAWWVRPGGGKSKKPARRTCGLVVSFVFRRVALRKQGKSYAVLLTCARIIPKLRRCN